MEVNLEFKNKSPKLPIVNAHLSARINKNHAIASTKPVFKKLQKSRG